MEGPTLTDLYSRAHYPTERDLEEDVNSLTSIELAWYALQPLLPPTMDTPCESNIVS
jgi:hypothetical protein